MTTTISSAKIRVLVCKLMLIVFLLTSVTSSFARPVPLASALQQQTYAVYDINPSSGAPGTDQPITVASHDPNVKGITARTRLFMPGVTISDVKMQAGNALTAKLSIPLDIAIPANTATLKTSLWLVDKDGPDSSVIGMGDFEIAVPGRGAVPPIGPAGVSKMWAVIPQNVVHSNFGHRIAGDYYAILVQIQNFSGFDIQIVGVGFTTTGQSKPLTVMSPPMSRIMPNNMYRSTRGTLEREHEFGRRAVTLSIIKALGNIYTGFLPFWRAPRPKANAGFAGNIFNGPFTTGFESIFPDTTVQQLVRLDDQSLKDGLVIKNGTADKTTVFVPRRVLNISNKAAAEEPPNDKRSDKKKVDWKNDSDYVAKKLGDLVIEGVPILSYGQTIKIVSANEITPKTAPALVTNSNSNSSKQKEKVKTSDQNPTEATPDKTKGSAASDKDKALKEDSSKPKKDGKKEDSRKPPQ